MKVQDARTVRRKFRPNTGLLLVLPSLLGMGIFYVVPFLDVVRRSFFRIISGEFAGLGNYVEVFQNSAFLLATKNTLRFWVVGLPLQLVQSFVFAMILTEKSKRIQWMKNLYLLPMVIPVACVAVFWTLFFDQYGLLNSLICRIGLEGKSWLDSGAAFGVLVISYVWRNVGYSTVLWTAGFAAIPGEQYDAAKIDGADGWALFRYITVPHMRRTLFLVVVLSILNSFRIFREAYLVAGEYPHESMYMIQHLYNNWYREFSFDKMAAASVVHFLIILVFVLALQSVWNREE